MNHTTPTQTYEFDADKYTIPELIEKLRLNNISSEADINDHIDKMIFSFSNTNIDTNNTNDNTQGLIFFLQKAKIRLFDYVKENYPLQLKPSNFDIIQSQSILEGGDHDITTNKVVPVVYTNKWEYPDGVINPVDKRVITKIICIDSLFRENYCSTSAGNFFWTLPENLKNVVSMRVVSLEIPSCTIYNISQQNQNNKFLIHLYNMTLNGATQPNISLMITIPNGNYTTSEFMTSINHLFQNIGQGLNFLYLDIDNISRKTIIRARLPSDPAPYNSPCPYDSSEPLNYSPNFYFIIDFVSECREIISNSACNQNYKLCERYIEDDDHQSMCHNYDDDIKKYNCKNYDEDNKKNRLKKSLGWYMGFRKPYYKVIKEDIYVDCITNPTTQVTYNAYLQSESTYGSALQNYIFLDINDFNMNEITDGFVSSTNNNLNEYIGNNILARIAFSKSELITSNEDMIFKQRDYLGPIRLNKLQIRLLNKFGDVVDLNENNFSFSLEVKILYQ